MKIVVLVNEFRENIKEIYLDEDSFWMLENEEKTIFECSYEERFNTLISLFTLKETWIKGNCYDKYSISFENKGRVEEYVFDDDLPFNFGVFNAHLVKLVGDVKC